jgi:hypothetical protein
MKEEGPPQRNATFNEWCQPLMTFGTCQYPSTRVQFQPMESGSAVTVNAAQPLHLTPSRHARSVTADPAASTDRGLVVVNTALTELDITP